MRSKKAKKQPKQRGQAMVWSLYKLLLLMNQGKKNNYEIYYNFINDVKSYV